MTTNLIRTSLALALLVAGTAAAQPVRPSETGAFPVPANRIVGLWNVSVTVAPCEGGPTSNLIGFTAFHAGGTITHASAAPPFALGPGQGIWRYEGHGEYTTRMKMYQFLPDGMFDGVTEVNTITSLPAQASQYNATVHALSFNADGSLRGELCGSAVGERIEVE